MNELVANAAKLTVRRTRPERGVKEKMQALTYLKKHLQTLFPLDQTPGNKMSFRAPSGSTLLLSCCSEVNEAGIAAARYLI